MKRRIYLIIKGKNATWSNTHTESTYYTQCYTAKKLLRLIVWRLRNQYIKIGNNIVKQIRGVGQGDNHSGHLCRLISIFYERKFMNYWIKEDQRVAKDFQHTIRKHDDYAFFNNELTKQFMYKSGLNRRYLPKYFELKWTTNNNHSRLLGYHNSYNRKPI